MLIEIDSATGVKTYYIYGNSLVSRIKATGTTSWYHYDIRANTIAMTNASQTITHKYCYDEYGNLLDKVEPTGDENLYRFLGSSGITYEADDLYFIRARFYDPTIGRFISEDPKWNTNLYAYANGNPIRYADVDGMAYVEVTGGAYLGIGTSKSYLFDGKNFYEKKSYGVGIGGGIAVSINLGSVQEGVSGSWNVAGGVFNVGLQGSMDLSQSGVSASAGLATGLSTPVMASINYNRTSKISESQIPISSINTLKNEYESSSSKADSKVTTVGVRRISRGVTRRPIVRKYPTLRLRRGKSGRWVPVIDLRRRR